MNITYSRSVITEVQLVTLAIAFVRLPVDPVSGAIGAPLWWNHAAGGYEDVYIPDRHLRLLTRASDDPKSSVGYGIQSFAVPKEALVPDMQGFLYQVTDANLAAKPVGTYSQVILEFYSGAG